MDIIKTNIPNQEPISLIDYYNEFLWYYPNCEMETKRWFVENIKDDWVVFDCGANIGYYSILFSRLAKNGLVYAFEPTETIEKLRNNLEYNEIKNVIPLQYALSDKTIRKVDGIFRIWGQQAEEKVYNFITIDDFVETLNIQKVDCIKIDVDSYDFEVLKGAKKTILKFNPYIMVELNHSLELRNTSNYEVFAWLANIGYVEGFVVEYQNVILKRTIDNSSNKLAFTLRFNSASKYLSIK